MSTTNAPAQAAPTRRAGPTHRTRATFLGVLRGEWIKLLSLRMTWWMLAATLTLITLISIALAYSLDAVAANPRTAATIPQTNAAELLSGGFQMGMLTIAALGSLIITAEYSSGMIRSSLAAVPTRVPVLLAKAIVLAVLTATISVVSISVSYLVTSPHLAGYGLVPPLGETRTWQVFGGTVYFLIVVALFSLAVGTLLRSSAGAITAALAVLLLLPIGLGFVHVGWVQSIADYLPLPASGAFLGGRSPESTMGESFSAVTGLLVVAAYAVVALIAAVFVLRRRDA